MIDLWYVSDIAMIFVSLALLAKPSKFLKYIVAGHVIAYHIYDLTKFVSLDILPQILVSCPVMHHMLAIFLSVLFIERDYPLRPVGIITFLHYTNNAIVYVYFRKYFKFISYLYNVSWLIPVVIHRELLGSLTVLSLIFVNYLYLKYTVVPDI